MEQTPLVYRQRCFFGELIDEIAAETKAKFINIRKHKRLMRKKGDREKLIKGLVHEVVECVLNDEKTVCRVCGSKLKCRINITESEMNRKEESCGESA